MNSFTSPMPPQVAINCPNCGKHAQFEFAICCCIVKKTHRPYFEKSEHFEVIDPSTAGQPKLAAYYPGLSPNIQNIKNLPEEYSTDMWRHGHYWSRDYEGDYGVATCQSCSLRRKHILDWPQDAYYQIEYRGEILWAFNKSTAHALLKYIESDERQLGIDGYGHFLFKIPTVFKSKKARDHIVKKFSQKMQLA